jgi:hypothetical protein
LPYAKLSIFIAAGEILEIQAFNVNPTGPRAGAADFENLRISFVLDRIDICVMVLKHEQPTLIPPSARLS